MPQAEQVLVDVARQAGGLVQDFWRRRRGKQDLPDMLQQLQLVIAGAFGITVKLQLERAGEGGKPRGRRLFAASDDAGQDQYAVPSTDGRLIWLPTAAEDAEVIKEFEHLRIMALQQAARAYRRSSATLWEAPDPLVRAIYEVLEADAADIDLVTRLRAMTGPLNAFRRLMLEQRPAPAELAPERRPLEQWIQEILEIPCEAAAQAREHPASRSLQLASELAHELLREHPEIHRQDAGVLHRDLWVGELRVYADPITSDGPHLVLTAEPGPAVTLIGSPTSTDGESSDLRVLFVDPPGTVELEEEEAVTALPPWVNGGQVQPRDQDVEATQPLVVSTALELRELTPSEAEQVAAQQAAALRVAARVDSLSVSLPSPAHHDVLGDVLVYPEWDYAAGGYSATGAPLALLAAPLGPEAWTDSVLDVHHELLLGIRRRFEVLRAQRRDSQDEVSLDAQVDAYADACAGLPQQASTQRAHGHCATMLLIDLSPASLEWVSSTHQLIDLQREAVLLVSLALYSLGEPYSVWAFSGDAAYTGMRCIKDFAEGYSDEVAQRIAGLRPERHSRTGAALRHATALLSAQAAQQRTLLLLSDGTPPQAQQYTGRYALEDVRQAVREARLQGISSLCFTTDQLSGSYLPSVFGEQQSTVLYRPELLPSALTQWLHRLLRS